MKSKPATRAKGRFAAGMKRSLAVIIMSILLFGLYPAEAGAAAENPGTAVYVKTGGTGNGLSAQSPLGSLKDAYNALGGKSGTIVICGPYIITSAFVAPAHSGTVTITGVYGNTDYRNSGASLTFDSSKLRYTLGGETIFKDLNIGCNSTEQYPTGVINARFNPVTFDTGCEMTHTGHRLYLVGGNQDTAGDYDKNPSITLKSGRFHLISGFSRTVTNQTFTGTASINLSGSVDVTNLYIGSVNGSDAGSAVIKVSEKARVSSFYLSGDMGVMKGDVTIIVDGGYIRNFSRVTFVKGSITLAYNPLTAQPEMAKMAKLARFDKIVTIKEFNGEIPPPPDLDLQPVASNTIFVSNSGTGTGKTPLYPTDDLEGAFSRLADTGGTIVICGEYTLPLNLSYTMNPVTAFAEPKHKGEITLTSVYDGVDYRVTNSAALVFNGNMHYRLSGPTVFKNIDFDATKGTTNNVIAACYNPVVFDEGCRMAKYDDASVDYKLLLVGGYQYYTYVDVAGKRYAQDEKGYLRVTSRSDPIEDSKNQVLADLITIPGTTKTMREEPALALAQMLSDIKAAGLRAPAVNEAFRTHERQYEIFTIYILQRMDAGRTYDEAYKITEEGVADPDTSDHRLGLAADIFHLDQGNNSFRSSPEYAWLVQHAHEYGFIVHYLEDKKIQTGTIFESWHFRYVGVEHAAAIKESGMCLEEYVGYLCGDFSLNSSVTIKSGTFSMVSGGSRNTDGLTFTGTASVNVSGTAVITDALWLGTANSVQSTVGAVSLTVTGGEISRIYVERIAGQSIFNYAPDSAQSDILDKISGEFSSTNVIAEEEQETVSAETAATETAFPSATQTELPETTANTRDRTGGLIGILSVVTLLVAGAAYILLKQKGIL